MKSGFFRRLTAEILACGMILTSGGIMAPAAAYAGESETVLVGVGSDGTTEAAASASTESPQTQAASETAAPATEAQTAAPATEQQTAAPATEAATSESTATEAPASATTESGSNATEAPASEAGTEEKGTEATEPTTTETASEKDSESESETEKVYELSATSGNVVIKLKNAAGFEEGTTVSAEYIDPTTDAYATYKAKAEDLVTTDDTEITYANFYDISIKDKNGNEIQPDSSVQVSFEYPKAVTVSADSIDMIHIHDNGATETVDFNMNATEVQAATEGDPAVKAISDVTFTADSFSVYGVVGSASVDQTPRATFNFVVDGKTVSTQIAKNNDSIVEPEVPGITDNQKFKGWKYTDENGKEVTMTFDVNTHKYTVSFKETDADGNKVDRTFTVTPILADVYHAVFYDYDVTNKKTSTKIVKTKEVTGTTVDLSDVKVDVNSNQKFMGWALKSSPTIILSDPYTVNGDIELVPVVADGAYVIFHSNDGDGTATHIQSQFVEAGAVPTAPTMNPTRQGYTFGGWYVDTACTIAYDFSNASMLNGTNLDLYAKWTPSSANYTVVFWRQDINGDTANNTYVYSDSDPRQATTGSTVSATDSDQNMSGDLYTGYHFDHADAAKTVNADGSTSINVYYNRNEITFNFYKSEWVSGHWEGLSYVLGHYVWALSQTMKGLYGQSLAQCGHTWPEPDGVWYRGTLNGTVMTYLGQFKLPTATDTVGNFYDNGNGHRSFYYYLQKADGTYTTNEAPSASTADAVGYSSGGTFNVTEKYEGYHASQRWQEGDWRSSGNWVSTADGDSFTPGSVNGVRYARNHYSLSFKDSYNTSTTYNNISQITATNNYGEVIGGVMFGVKLSNYEPNTEQNPTSTRTGYVFDGWYADQACTTRFNFNTEMPASNVTVYAGWRKTTVTVTLKSNGGTFADGTTEDKIFTLDYDSLMSNDIQEAMSGTSREGFSCLGWGQTTANGPAWNIEYDHVTGNVTLVANWKYDGSIKVAYDFNGGTGNISDTNDYSDGSSAIVKQGKPTYTGHQFIGWLTPDGKLVNANDVIDIVSTTAERKGADNGVYTLKAQYDEVEKTSITLHGNGGKVDGEDDLTLSNRQMNSAVNLNDHVPTKDHAIFKGWAESADDATVGTVKWQKDDTIFCDGTTTNEIWAVWEDVYSLTVHKVLDDENSQYVDSSAQFGFTVTLTKVLDGKTVEVTKDAVGNNINNTCTLGFNGSYKIDNLPAGTSYEVTETSGGGNFTQQYSKDGTSYSNEHTGKLTGTDYDQHVYVKNKTKIVPTGVDINTNAIMVAVLLISLMGAAYVILASKRSKERR